MIRSSVLAFLCLAVVGTPLVAAAECYGPVGRDDSLWLIALRLRPDASISPQRMMLALLEANPGAFRRNNINALNAGSTVCLGPPDSIGTDEQAAVAEVHRQNQEWKSGAAPAGSGSRVRAPEPNEATAGGEEPARPNRTVATETFEAAPARSPVRDREPYGEVRIDRALAAFESRLSQMEHRLEHPGPGYRRADATLVEEDLARLAARVARIEEQIRELAPLLETVDDDAVESEAMEPMPTPAPQSHAAMEPMPTPAPRSHAAMEPMPTPAPRSHAAMEPMPTPAPQSHAAMEPMPTPAPQSHAAMEPMPTPAPQSHAAMEPMPTPAPQPREPEGPEPEPSPEDPDFIESLFRPVAAWVEQAWKLLSR